MSVSAVRREFAEQSVATHQLVGLRRGRDGAPGWKLYGQPASRLVDLVSCPHYLVEILLYAGLLAVAAEEGLLQSKTALLLVWLSIILGASDTRCTHVESTVLRQDGLCKTEPPSKHCIAGFLLGVIARERSG